jgi:GNAT superfamily N-acetyltransferase
MSAVLQRMSPADWERVRALRLAALIESPDAFSMTLALELGRTPESWQQRLGLEDVATFVAAVGERDVGLVVSAPYDGQPDALGLFAMWVAPSHRGRGIGGALVDAVVAWARGRGARRIVLDVADANAPAVALYAAKGFQPTGVVGVLAPDRAHVREHQRALAL